jgi:hypothetical protein
MNSMSTRCRIVRSLPPPARRIHTFSLRLLVVALLASLPHPTRSDSTGIPGTTQTLNGYDTEMGEDAMCWSSLASPTQEGGIPFPNGVLVANFSLADKVELLRSCPNGTHLHGRSPPEFADATFRPRTGEWYNYTVYGRLDLTALNGLYVASDTGSKISVSVVACDSVLAGFCSPFVHDQANLRVGQETAKLRAEAEAQATAHGQTLAPEPPPVKKYPGKSHGGTHVHSPAIIVEIPPEANVAYEFSIDVPVLVLEPSHFFVIVTLQFFTGDSPLTPKYRYDVSNALGASERYVSYQDPAMILEVTREVRLFSCVCVGITSMVLLGLIFQTIRHYNHQVMRLSQGPFLLLFLLAALCATISSILLEPKNSLWCNLSLPLIVIPLQLLYAITLGRLWRIHAVVSPLLRNRLEHRKNDTRDHNWLQRVWHKAKTSLQPRTKVAVLRREVSAITMAWLVLACTAPQVVLQTLSWVLQPQDKGIEYNEDQSIGRSICISDATASRSLVRYSMLMLLLLVMTLLGMAHVSRKLPSLLNESAVIYETTLVSVLMMILSMGIQSITDNPTTSPDVAYIINIVLVLSITLNATLRIMIPKLYLIWTGQQVLVSQLVSDHKQRLHQSTDFTESSSRMYNVSGFIMEPSCASQLHHHDGDDEDLWAGASGNLKGSSIHLATSSTFSDNATPPSPSSTTKHDDDGDNRDLEEGGPKQQDASNSVSSQEVWLKAVEKDGSQRLDDDDEKMVIVQQEHPALLSSSQALQAPPKNSARVCFADDEMKKVTSKGAAAAAAAAATAKKKVVIRQGQAPSKQLVIRMVDLHHELDRVNNRVMSGMNVEPDDWNLVRELTIRLEGMFANVEFEWERKQLLDNLTEEGR